MQGAQHSSCKQRPCGLLWFLPIGTKDRGPQGRWLFPESPCFQTTLAVPHCRLCRAHSGGLSGRVLSILSHFPPSDFPPSACHLKRLLSLVLLITPVLRDGLTKPKQQNVPKNKKLNPRPALLHTRASVNSSGHCLLASLPFSKDTIKGEIRAEGTSLGRSSAY